MDGLFNFCHHCKKKGRILTNLIKCKCDKYTCRDCREPKTHQCSFDYLSNHQSKLEQSLEKVNGNKFNVLK